MNTHLPHSSVGYHFHSNLSLPMLQGIGFHYIDNHSYSWNNRKRKNEYCLLQYTVSGSGILEDEGILYPQVKGDAFLVNIPGESHYYLPESSDFWEVLYLEFSKDSLPLLYKIKGLSGSTLHLQNQESIHNEILKIYKLALSNELKTFFENTKIAYSLLMDLTAFSISNFNQKTCKADIAKNYIDNHYFSSSLNLDEIAEHSGVSKFYITREFHKKFSKTPGKYLIDLRIQQSCRLLQQNSQYTLDEIARLVGFTNSSYFGKVFKRIKGITPNQYRNQNQQYDFVRVIYDSPRVLPENDI